MINGGHGFAMGWYWIIGIILVALIIWAIARGSNQNNNSLQQPEKSALDILKERYARGEIDKQEFENLKKDLL